MFQWTQRTMKTSPKTQVPGLDTMGLLLVLWLCTLPFIGLLIAPLLGAKVAALAAIVLLVALLVYCWGSCILQVVRFVYSSLLNGRHTQDRE